MMITCKPTFGTADDDIVDLQLEDDELAMLVLTDPDFMIYDKIQFEKDPVFRFDEPVQRLLKETKGHSIVKHCNASYTDTAPFASGFAADRSVSYIVSAKGLILLSFVTARGYSLNNNARECSMQQFYPIILNIFKEAG